MLKLEHTNVSGWLAAIRGMRNPMNSWEKSDTFHYTGASYEDVLGNFGIYEGPEVGYVIGENDHDLMMRLAKSGTEHAKYRRMIVVTVDITAPLYWWKEFDTYKVGTVANSCSTMHKIQAKEFTLNDFSCEHLDDAEICYEEDVCDPFLNPCYTSIDILKLKIKALNYWRDRYNETKDKHAWYQMIQLLDSSYNQKRTVMMNYENLSAMYRQRKNHKLDEWHTFCDWIKTLPHSEIITMEEE